MMTLKPSKPSFSPRYVDMLYMSTSALTVSGLNSVELENFSSSQIVVLTLLMLLGGEAFTSMLSLLFRKLKYNKPENTESRIDANDIELEPRDIPINAITHVEAGQNIAVVVSSDNSSSIDKDKKYNSIRYLLFIVFSYIFFIHVSGSIFILLYVSLVSSARDVLNGRGIPKILFSISVTVSSFANAGLIPTNENMVIFKKNPGLLLIIIPQILAGNTLFPVFLRLILWALKKITRREQFSYIMKNSKRVNYSGLMSNKLTACLAMTVISLIVAQLTLYWAMDWNSAVFDGLTSYQKIVNALFMAVNSRHAGEGTLDLSITAPSVLILFIIVMYLPGSTAYVPFDLKEKDIEEEEEEEEEDDKKRKRMSTRKSFVHKYVFSHITCLAIFVMAICITERKKLSKDPLNFPVLNILLEVVSAYGNVGFSTGYSCGRQLVPDKTCEDKWISLSGKWSDKGKLILVVVLLFGRLKKFTMEAGRAWILS
ncbi:Cation transporter protein [Dioscorea alata]|uniref:Cation transporter protein n=1 Tax=Dioscorea alata TaxID=55571 RepID=A0ACB7VD23_DIOAL|nr:Cation transporter protein [Dioscorea alata]